MKPATSLSPLPISRYLPPRPPPPKKAAAPCFRKGPRWERCAHKPSSVPAGGFLANPHRRGLGQGPSGGRDHFSSRTVACAISSSLPALSRSNRAVWATLADGPKKGCVTLHATGFAMPRLLPVERWALTPPFHPYLIVPIPERSGAPSAVYSLWHCPALATQCERAVVNRRRVLPCSDFPPRCWAFAHGAAVALHTDI